MTGYNACDVDGKFQLEVASAPVLIRLEEVIGAAEEGEGIEAEGEHGGWRAEDDGDGGDVGESGGESAGRDKEGDGSAGREVETEVGGETQTDGSEEVTDDGGR